MARDNLPRTSLLPAPESKAMNHDEAHGVPESRHLSIRLLTLILLVSSVLTLLLTAWQLWADYERELDGIEERLQVLEHTTLQPLSNSVWSLNEEQIRLLLAGMRNLEPVVAVELDTDQGRHYFLGEIPTGNRGETRQYLLYHDAQQPVEAPSQIGKLTVYTSLQDVYARLLDRAANILVGQALKTFLVSVFILLIVQRLVTRHLGRIADYARQLSTQTLDTPLRLQRVRSRHALPDELDQVEAAINFMRESIVADIERRAATEQRLQASEARYRQLFRSSSDGLCIFDAEGHLIQANPAFLSMLGYPPDALPELTLATMTADSWRQLDEQHLARTLATGSSEEYRKELLGRAGNRVPVSVRLWTVGSPGPARVLMQRARDIRHELDIESERQRLAHHASEAKRLETVGTLAGGVAHEFNNLLTPIKGYAELIARESAGATASRAEAIAHAAERGRKLVEKILLLGRKGASQRVETDIAALARETLELAQLSRPAHVRTTLRVDAPDCRTTVDPTQMHQALMNVLANAFAAMPAGGLVNVNISEDQRQGKTGLVIRVTDQGSGIPAEILPRIFEPFYSTHGNSGNSGLGLAVVNAILAAHGGEIEVSSDDKGTQVTMYLPRLARPPTD